MNVWQVEYTQEAAKDLRKIKEPVKSHVLKAIRKVSTNPLPQSEGGYGKPLSNRNGSNLAGFLKIKIRGDGVRIVYQLRRTETTMSIVVIGIRDDDWVYKEADRRINR